MSGRETKVKQIPYGISDYAKIVSDNLYFVDKTPYLKSIEQAGDYLFFIRPRRFGKSLFISILDVYLDVLYKDRFEEFFKGTWIYDHPTDQRHKYLVLKFNFSAVDPHGSRLEDSFLHHVRTKVTSFLYRYGDILKHRQREKIIDQLPRMKSAADILLSVVELCGLLKQKLFIVIDEYDNFANTILTTSGQTAYEELTHGEGFFRAFFNFLKEGTTSTDAPISRMFITGVSPVTLDDVTSGFNIGKNISIKPEYNEMLGFTEKEVIGIIDYYREKGMVAHSNDYLMKIITQWYNNYTFSKDAHTTLYNSDMVLYFMDEYLRKSEIPDQLIDRNVRIDYGKLRHLIILDSEQGKTVNGNFSRLKEIVQEGKIATEKIIEGFPVEKLTHTENFVSLLFYFGLLTVKGVEDDEPVLQIPNETVRRLYYDYIKEAYDETGTFSMDWYRYGRLMHDMAYNGDWEPLFRYIAQQMSDSMGLRDLLTGEKSIQAFLNVYLGLSDLYIIHPEKEMNKGFADIVMEPFLARYKGMKFTYLLELKYLKKKESEKKLQSTIDAAKKQLRQYAIDEKFKRAIGQTTIVKLVLVFAGTELEYIGAV